MIQEIKGNIPRTKCSECDLPSFNLTKIKDKYTCTTCKVLFSIEMGRIDREILIVLELNRDNEKYYVRGEKYVVCHCGGCGYAEPKPSKRSCLKCGKLNVRGTSIFQLCWSCLNNKLMYITIDTQELSEDLKFYQQIHINWLSNARKIYRDHTHNYHPTLAIDRIKPDTTLFMFDGNRYTIKQELERVLDIYLPSLKLFISSFV